MYEYKQPYYLYLLQATLLLQYNVEIKTLLPQGVSEPKFYGDLVYKFRKKIGKYDFPYHFKKIIVPYKKIGCNIDVLPHTACLIVSPIKATNFANIFDCKTVGGW